MHLDWLHSQISIVIVFVMFCKRPLKLNDLRMSHCGVCQPKILDCHFTVVDCQKRLQFAQQQ